VCTSVGKLTLRRATTQRTELAAGGRTAKPPENLIEKRVLTDTSERTSHGLKNRCGPPLCVVELRSGTSPLG
jgi:hypothetical protein